MSIISVFYIVGCLLSYMRVNAFERYWEDLGVESDPVLIAFYTVTSWIGFTIGSFLFITKREKGEKFFKL